MLIGAGLSPSPSVYYQPRPSVAPSARYTPPAPRPSGSTAPADFSALESFANSEAGQQQFAQSQPQTQQEPGGFFGSPFGKGLGFVINNPVTRVLAAPINYIQTGGRLATLGVEEAAEGLAGAPSWLQNTVGAIPGVSQLLQNVDVERTEADKRSFYDKILNPHTTYGYGELLDPDNPSWVNNIGGMLGDVALDPLTYITGGASRIVEGASHADEALRGLKEATEALKVAQEAGKASDIARATERLGMAEDYVARAPTLGKRYFEVPLPHNRAGRVDLLGELTETPAGRQFLQEMPEQAARAGERGFQTITPEAKQLLGIQEPGLRLRGFGTKIPGTGKISEGLNILGGAFRAGVGELPYATKKIANIRVPRGMLQSYNVLSRGVEGDVWREASHIGGGNVGRLGMGQQLARGNRILSQGVKDFFKGKDKDVVRGMVSAAEKEAEPNDINRILGDILSTFEDITGKTIDPAYKKDPNRYFPHLLDPRFRRALGRMAKKGNQSALDFMRHLGLVEDDLLEQTDASFFLDDLMEGSGFLSKSRKFGPNPETGAPQTFKIGGEEVTFSEDNVDHLNEMLHKAFPQYKGDFYDTDPTRVIEAYNKSLSRQAGRDAYTKWALQTGNPLLGTVTGDVEKTRVAMNEALAMQGDSNLIASAQGKYTPGGVAQPQLAEWSDDVATAFQGLPTDEQKAVVDAVQSRQLADVAAGRPISAQQKSLAEEMARRGHIEAPRTPNVPEVSPAPIVPGSLREREPIEKLRAAAAAATDPDQARVLNAEADRLEAAVKASRIGGVEPSDYFVTEVGKNATAARDAAAKRAGTWATAAAAETREAEEALRKRVAGLKEIIINPLKTAVKDTTEEIKVVNKRIRTWAKKSKELIGKDWKDITTDDQDEITDLLVKVNETVTNAETKLQRTRTAWKGAATRKQRSAEAKLRQSLQDMYTLRDKIQAKLDAAPTGLAEEIRAREAVLNQPVREAHERLLRAEMEFARGRALPHNQATVEGAMDALEHELANTDTDPEELLQRFRDTIEDVRTGARNVQALGTEDSPAAAHARQVYAAVLEEIEEIKGRTYRGKLSKANQALLDDAITRRNQLRLALGEGLTPGGAPARVSAFDEAAIELADARAELNAARLYKPPTQEEIAAVMERIAAGENINLADLGKGAGAGDIPRLQAEVRRLERQFRRGGRFYEEQKARDILKDVAAYDAEMAADTGVAEARKNLEQKLFQRERTQESIIWKKPREAPSELGVVEPTPGERVGALPRITGGPQEVGGRAGNRYVTAPGEPKSNLEMMGRGTDESRIWEPIPRNPGEAPQPEAWFTQNPQPVLYPGSRLIPTKKAGFFEDSTTGIVYNLKNGSYYDVGEGKWLPGLPPEKGYGRWGPQPIPSPRTEQEAIASLRSLDLTGGAATMGARSEMNELAPQIAEAERTLPANIAEAQARVAKETAAQADAALGPLAERAQTYTNLATDLTDKSQLVAKREEARVLRERIRANPTSRYTDLGRVLDDLEGVAKANPYLDDPKLNEVESLLHTHRRELERIEETTMRYQDLDRVAQDAANGKLPKVMIATVNNNWRLLHKGPVNTGDIIMDAELYKRFTNLFELNRQPQLLGRTFNAFTNLFKTYATLSPGFHVRNTIGGIFMNTSDGVTLAHQLEGAQLWRQFSRGGEDWLKAQPRRVREAFAAAMGSGAGGRFEESGVLARTENRLYNLISSNPLTRLSQRAGTKVEGAMRLGMALHSIDRGESVQSALTRITRIHFDYSQVSEIDETMKRIIPFWTFMSRNLPLQIQQMWTNPRVYSYYNNLVNNFDLPDEEFTPEYWTRQGAWRTPIEAGGNPLYLQPDLGFTRMQSDLQMLEQLASGENPGAVFSQANPLIGATLDFMNKRDSFYNRSYDDTDYTKQSGIVGAPVSFLASLLGQTNEMGQVSDNFTNYLTSLIPPLNQATRLFPGASGGDANWQTAAKWARWGGAPIQLLTPQAQDSEYWRQWRAIQDEQDRQKAMLQEAAS